MKRDLQSTHKVRDDTRLLLFSIELNLPYVECPRRCKDVKNSAYASHSHECSNLLTCFAWRPLTSMLCGSQTSVMLLRAIEGFLHRWLTVLEWDNMHCTFAAACCTLKSVRNIRMCPAMMPLCVCLKWSQATWPVRYGRLAYQAKIFFSMPSYMLSISCKPVYHHSSTMMASRGVWTTKYLQACSCSGQACARHHVCMNSN